MTAPTDTPRTDAAGYAAVLRSVAKHILAGTVTADEVNDAAERLETLERELAAALAEVKRLNEWADGMTDAALKERQTGEMYQRELRAEIGRLRQQQDELVWRVIFQFSVEAVNCARYGSVSPDVEEIIARVRAEMEKEKGNG